MKIEVEEYSDIPADFDNDVAASSGLELAMQRAENLVHSGAREVKVWKKVGEASAATVVKWEKSDEPRD